MAKRVIIVGSGILGASIAWHLATAGAEVTVLDGSDTGGLATRASWAWINGGRDSDQDHFRLRRRAMLEWRRLDREVPGLSVNWCGSLVWDLEAEKLETFARDYSAWGYGIRRVGRAEALLIEPRLKQPPELALHVAEDGMIEPVAAARAMLAGAQGLGAEVFAHMRVKWLVEDGGRVAGVMTEEGVIHGDEIVVAAGAGTVPLLDSIGIGFRMTTPPGLLIHSKPAGELLRGLIIAPGLHVRQTAEGRLVAGADFTGTDPMDHADAMARGLHAKLQAMIAGAENLESDLLTTGYRSTPADGFPAVGRVANREALYIAVSHSGVTLAPAIGLFAAQELLDGERDPLLALYRPDRPALA